MPIKAGVLALVTFLLGLYLGFNNSRWVEMEGIARTCVEQQKLQHDIISAYKTVTRECLHPFTGKRK